MFWRKTIDPNERQTVLELLGRWTRAVNRVDSAMDAAMYVVAKQPLGIQSDEFEKARLEALAVVKDVQDETTQQHFWPILDDNQGGILMFRLREKLDESYGHQLNLLNLQGAAAEAFRAGRDQEAPTTREIMGANQAFARVLDDIGKAAGKLARHYRISAQESQSQLL